MRYPPSWYFEPLSKELQDRAIPPDACLSREKAMAAAQDWLEDVAGDGTIPPGSYDFDIAGVPERGPATHELVTLDVSAPDEDPRNDIDYHEQGGNFDYEAEQARRRE